MVKKEDRNLSIIISKCTNKQPLFLSYPHLPICCRKNQQFNHNISQLFLHLKIIILKYNIIVTMMLKWCCFYFSHIIDFIIVIVNNTNSIKIWYNNKCQKNIHCNTI